MYAASDGSEDFPPAHIWLHSYSSTLVQVDLQGSHWLSPPISSQPGWPIWSCSRCPPLCHLCAPHPPFRTWKLKCIPYGTHMPSRGSGYFKEMVICEKNVHVFVYLNSFRKQKMWNICWLGDFLKFFTVLLYLLSNIRKNNKNAWRWRTPAKFSIPRSIFPLLLYWSCQMQVVFSCLLGIFPLASFCFCSCLWLMDLKGWWSLSQIDFCSGAKMVYWVELSTCWEAVNMPKFRKTAFDMLLYSIQPVGKEKAVCVICQSGFTHVAVIVLVEKQTQFLAH